MKNYLQFYFKDSKRDHWNIIAEQQTETEWYCSLYSGDDAITLVEGVLYTNEGNVPTLIEIMQCIGSNFMYFIIQCSHEAKQIS